MHMVACATTGTDDAAQFVTSRLRAPEATEADGQPRSARSAAPFEDHLAAGPPGGAQSGAPAKPARRARPSWDVPRRRGFAAGTSGEATEGQRGPRARPARTTTNRAPRKTHRRREQFRLLDERADDCTDQPVPRSHSRRPSSSTGSAYAWADRLRGGT